MNETAKKGSADLRNLFYRNIGGRLVRCTLACACALFGTSSAPGDPIKAPAEITTFHEFYSLTSEQALKGVPVQIEGVVICFDAGWNQLYVHDGAETVWLSPTLFQTNLPNLQAGQKVRLMGSTAPGQGGVAFTNLNLQVLGEGKIPAAKSLEISQLGGDFGQWVEIRGRIRLADTSPGRLSLIVEDKGYTSLVYVMGLPATNDFSALRRCSVRIRGINASQTAGGRLSSASIFTPGLAAITVVGQSDSKPSDLPVTSVEALLGRELGSWTNDPVHIKGLLAAYTPGDSLVVKDYTGSINARVIQTTEAQIDDSVDVWGYLTVLSNGPVLQDAYFEVQPAAATKTPLTSSDPGKPGSAGNKEITRFSDISKMRPEQAAKGFQVRLQGTVTYADSDWRIYFIQGQDGALCLDQAKSEVKAGQWVEVTGRTGRGGFAPEVLDTSIRVLANTNLPAPVKTDLEDLASGNLDSHWVQLEGVVRRMTEQWGHVTLMLTTAKGRFKAIVLKASDRAMPTGLIGALVSIRGACTSEMNARGQLTGIVLHVPDSEQIRILEAVPADPFAVPATAIGSVATFDPTRMTGRRLKVSGSVTHVMPGQGFFVQDVSGGIRIDSAQTNSLQVGDTVDVLGFPAINDFSPYLEEVLFQRTGSTLLPKPQPTTAEEILLHGTNDATLIQIEGQLMQNVRGAARPKLVLQSGPIIFNATLAAQFSDRKIPDLQIGSLLRLVGVCSIQGGENREPESFRLLAAGPQSVTLVRSPPWWTMRYTIVLAASLVVGLLLAWGWNSSLRRRVAAQTETIRRNEGELIKVSRQAGMAEVATAVLHNVGNVLNSVNVSASLAVDELRKSKAADVSLAAAMMKQHAPDLGDFMTRDPKGCKLPDYLAKLGEHLLEKNRFVLDELQSLTSHIEHIKHIVAMQQNHSKFGGVTETVKVAELIEESLQMNASALANHNIQVVREYATTPQVEALIERYKVLQIMVNIISNAKHACIECGRPEKRLTIRVTTGTDRVQIAFMDNGVGIPRENLTRIFTHGFTTRENGHGFGLHSAALAAQELGGTLLAQSEGSGKGATFILELPRTAKRK